MTYILSSGALNSTHSLLRCLSIIWIQLHRKTDQRDLVRLHRLILEETRINCLLLLAYIL